MNTARLESLKFQSFECQIRISQLSLEKNRLIRRHRKYLSEINSHLKNLTTDLEKYQSEIEFWGGKALPSPDLPPWEVGNIERRELTERRGAREERLSALGLEARGQVMPTRYAFINDDENNSWEDDEVPTKYVEAKEYDKISEELKKVSAELESVRQRLCFCDHRGVIPRKDMGWGQQAAAIERLLETYFDGMIATCVNDKSDYGDGTNPLIKIECKVRQKK